ncbi:MAG: hypothetical protein P8X42_09605 [Calditrichaceae bacterium]|jgi:CheY-like chemotaxis protein
MNTTAEKNHPHILIVDEVTANKVRLTELLSILKFRTYTVNENQDPLEVFQKHKSNINFIILNMIKPTVPNGIETLQRLKKIDPMSKVICMGDNTALIDNQIKNMDNFSFVNGTINLYQLLRGLNITPAN